jgi:hypothetical protein
MEGRFLKEISEEHLPVLFLFQRKKITEILKKS